MLFALLGTVAVHAATLEHKQKHVSPLDQQARQLPEEMPVAWEETRRYLESRVIEAPSDARARLALAQLQATRRSTWRTGIVQLAQLAQSSPDPQTQNAALDSWRDALGWTNGQPADSILFEAYLRMRPDDLAVRQSLENLYPHASTSSLSGEVGKARSSRLTLPVSQNTQKEIRKPSVRRDELAFAPISIVGNDGVEPPRQSLPLLAEHMEDEAGLDEGVQLASAQSFNGAVIETSPSQLSLASKASSRIGNLQEEIASIETEERNNAPQLSIGTVVRSRRGEKGLSTLEDVETPLQLAFALGSGKTTLNITPVSLQAGAAATDFNTLSRFGNGSAVARAQPGVSAGSQSNSGVGVGVGYESGNFQADIGTTPIGFIYTDLNAGLRYRFPVGQDFSISATASRRPVTDSVLSFAGARDSRTGETWGGVSATGGRLDANLDKRTFGAYAFGSAHRVTGHQVESNTRNEAGTGIYARFLRTEDTALTVGLSLDVLSFDKNLSNFTLGHGGYYSPQQFQSLAVPVEWRQRSGQFSYQLNGSIGVQHARLDASPYFPLNAALQNTTGLSYSAQSKTSASYNFAAAFEYQLDPQLFFGGLIGLDNARDYRQFAGSVYLRYAFRPFDGPLASPVNSVRSPYGS